MVDVSFRIDAESVVRDLQRMSDNADKELVGALNDAAFALRTKWLQSIVSDIDNPTGFTKSRGAVLVDKAKASESPVEAKVKLGKKQNEYLGILVEGGTRRGGIGSIRGQIVTPVKARLNRFGNLPFGPPRYVGSVAQKIKGGFIGTVGQSDRRAVYQRLKSGRAKLLAVFNEQVTYTPSLPLFDIANSFGDELFQIIDRRIERLIG